MQIGFLDFTLKKSTTFTTSYHCHGMPLLMKVSMKISLEKKKTKNEKATYS